MGNDTLSLFRGYMGTGLIVILYLFSLIYLFLKEEKKYVRVTFVLVPVGLLLVYFNPVFARIVYRAAGEEIYYRILWLLPLSAGIAYTVCHIYGHAEGKLRVACVLCAAAIIACSGKFVYDSPFFSKAENRYHVPESVVHVCDAIIVPGREVMAAFPTELVQYVRQYTPLVCMPYGREVLVERWGQFNDVAEAMERNPVDLEELMPLANQNHCHYLIFREEKEILGKPQDYGLELFGRMDGYVIYRNLNEPLETNYLVP